MLTELCIKKVNTNPCSWRDHRKNALILKQIKDLLCDLDLQVDVEVISINENLVSGDSVALPEIVAKNKIIFVEIDGIKIDHQTIAGVGEIYWTISTNVVTFSQTLTYVNIKIAYLKNTLS